MAVRGLVWAAAAHTLAYHAAATAACILVALVVTAYAALAQPGFWVLAATSTLCAVAATGSLLRSLWYTRRAVTQLADAAVAQVTTADVAPSMGTEADGEAIRRWWPPLTRSTIALGVLDIVGAYVSWRLSGSAIPSVEVTVAGVACFATVGAWVSLQGSISTPN